ncbi:non-ribosomal peptide synthetase [Pseudomonas chlororaphis]|uniref:Mycosubtilin synthase subunit B n=1 Tax=Pseudomonas chlororaphis TaxID=587753 RepID=A0AAX3FRR2_9PSED|nr:non-ribosomal peptide synthetase [Pseudomonas chlororaphis]AZC38807.1 Non-ribosomal peptide synthetase [Pseudomonas chlororaphis subsp. piscium]AZC45357.1 Non-ribosomal peptide synthetase [Pseudomonas chlororaphis subsp. piscium]WDG70921.1 non-ribosomal peptide synthase/polyketide synthase [Pseudomonas chlororaphis]WDH31293.1 non-ribosomal peptide synthase/polyketide synthase [Pseudomonas chlororaphis]WDH69447.1 non-ribosomal peptide synthase/polyketide synthase [Pseudomonas chlororaphis]
MQALIDSVGTLSAKERKALAILLKEKGINLFGIAPICSRGADEAPVLSYTQESQWFLWQLEPDSSAYHITTALRLTGELDLDALRHGFDSLIARHETLRTTFCEEDGIAVQVVHPPAPLHIEVIDLHTGGLSYEEQVNALTDSKRQPPFDLRNGPLLRASLLRVAADEHVLVLTQHHIVSDGWSMGVMVDELIQLYAGYRQGRTINLPDLPIQYADYANWQRQWMDAGERERQLGYWLQQLGGEQPLLMLPLDHSRPAIQSYRGALFDIPLGDELRVGLKQLAQREGATLFMLLLASFQVLLHRYSGQADIRVGVPTANRNRVETERLIGFFVNTQVFKAEVDGQLGFIDFLQQVKQTALMAQSHQDLPFEQLVEALRPERSLSHSPLFQVMFNHQTAVKKGAHSQRLDDLSIETLSWQGRAAQFDLTLDTFESEDGLWASLTYATDLFEPSTIERLAQSWVQLLQGIVQQPRQRLGDLPLLAASEQNKLLHEWAPASVEFPSEHCVHQLVEAQARKTPEAEALLFAGQRLDYQTLNARANRLAHKLIELGVGPEVRVGVALQRTPEMVVALLAVLKAGGAYVPLDPDYPQDRLAHMLRDSQAQILLTESALLSLLPAVESLKTLQLDAQPGWLDGYSPDNPAPRATADNLAYVIYTSGSTGLPKGVAIAHRNVLALIDWSSRVYSADDLQGVLASTSICFDLSVWELFVTLSSGGSIVLARNALELPELADRDRVRLINTVPSAIAALQRSGQIPSGVRIINLAGEPLKQALVDTLYQQPGLVHVYDLYGPSEDTTYSTYTRREAGGQANIGRAISNTQSYILSPDLQPVPVSSAGELYLAGAGVTRGYLARPGLTAEKFVPNPFSSDGGRVYRTGDLTRYRADGVIEYIGRIDHQVKIRGFRIELGEIEARLVQQAAVREAFVLAHDGDNGQQLVAYIVPSDAEAAVAGDAQVALRESIKTALKEHLPDYMVPAYLLFLEALPLTPNGKLDRKALPKVDAQQLQQVYVAPQTELEQQIAAIWADVLKLEQVGVTDNFFELGGDSIISIQVVSRARQAGIRFTPRDLFQYQTVQGLAAVAEQGEGGVQIDQGPVRGATALLPVQQWFFDSPMNERHHWNQSVLLKPAQALRAEVVENALQVLWVQHDALRLQFSQQADGWSARFADASQRPSLLWQVAVDNPQAMEQSAIAAQRSLNLQDGPLLRAVLFSLADGSQRLLLVIHHLVVDGVSWRILLEDLQLAHAQLSAGQPLALSAKTSSTQAWAEHMQAYAQGAALQQELGYWQAQLQGVESSLPVDHPVTPLQNQHASSLSSRLDKAHTQRLLQDAPAAYRTQINDLLLTALARVITRWTGEASALVQLEGHGREDLFDNLDLTRTVGWFTSMFPVKLTPQAALADSIKQIKEQLRAVPNKGIGFGALRYLGDEAAQRTLAALAVPRITFNYLGQFDGSFDEQDSLFKPTGEAKGDDQSPLAPLSNWLSLDGQVYGGELSLSWTFSTQMFDAATIQRLADDYAAELKALVAHCCEPGQGGATPSDFPLAGLDQQQLDRLPVALAEVEDLYPLSPMQQGMLFHTLYEQAAGDYINQLRVDVDGLDPLRFQQAWQAAIDRHDILRTGFIWQGEVSTPLQVVHKHIALDCSEHDWRGQPQQQEALDSLAAAERQRGFELDAVPLLRLTLVRIDDQRHHLIYTNHHILMDGWSNSQLLGEVLQRYAGQLPNHAPGRYRDYIGWLQRQDAQACENFWKEQLQALDEPTRLTQALSRVAEIPAGAGHGKHQRELDLAQTARLGEFARQQKVTVNTLVQAAWLLLLQRCTGQESVVFGATVAGRPAELKGIEQQVGLFINTLPVVATPRPDMTVSQWLQAVQSRNLALRDYEYTPLYEVQRWAGLGGDALFDNILVFENYPVSEALEKGAPAQLQFGAVGNHEQTNYPLTVAVNLGQSLSFEFIYARESFSEASMLQLGGHLQSLLLSLMAHPQTGLGELPLLTLEEQRGIRQDWDHTQVVYPTNRFVHQLFADQAAKAPEAPAVFFAEQRLSYRELDIQANRLAHKLIELGVGPEVRVAIAMPRCAEIMVAFLAVLKAGGVYVPLDIEYPQDRLRYMMQDSGAWLLLTQSHLLDRLPIPDGLPTLSVEGAADFAAYPMTSPQVTLAEENLAYVIYTSGSTGLPKGVAVSHGPLAMHSLATGERYEMSPADCELHFMSFAFDGSHEGWMHPLIYGASVLIRDDSLWSPEYTYEQMHRYGVTVGVFPPVYLQQLAVHAERDGNPPAVRVYCFGGDAVPQASYDLAWRVLRPKYIFNGYGPTETVVTPLIWKAKAGDPCDAAYAPIGNIVGNRSAYVADANLNLLPVGVAGELYLGGLGVARGYLDRPGLTAERFIPDPYSTSGARLYRSGDLTRYRTDGLVEYVGRVDHQVKVRGFRIELGEIEARLLEQDPVLEVAVIAQPGPSGQQLVGYIVPVDAEVALSNERQAQLRESIKARLRENLPDYMVPTYLLFLEALPLTPNGKLDRKSLPKVDAQLMQQTYVAPQNQLEQQIAAIWADVLKLEQVGVTDNFFELGGDSIISIQVVSRARQAGIRFTPKDLFQHQTVQGLATVAEQGEGGLQIDQGPVRGTTALLPIQQWFFDTPVPERHHWNQSVLLKPAQPLQADVLETALQALTVQHDALRLRFVEGEGGWSAAFSEFDEQAQLLWQASVANDQELQQFSERAQRSLNLQDGPLLRGVLFTLADQSQRLLLIFHHLVVDGVSWRILLEDLQALLGNRPLPAKSSSTQAWAGQLQAYARSAALQQELAYWQAQLQGVDSSLPWDHASDGLQNQHACSVDTRLSKSDTQRLLQDAPAAYRTQINDLLLTALARVITRWTGSDSALVQLEGHGREELFDSIDLSRTVGWFTSVFPVKLTPQAALADSIKQIKEQLRAVPNKGIGFGALRYLGDEAARQTLAALAVPRITFNYLGQFDASFDEEQALFTPAREAKGEDQSPQAPLGNWLTLNGQVYGGELSLGWSFSQAMFEPATIQRLADDYAEELKALIEHCSQPEHRGVTPSDFPLARLNQQQLDRLPVPLAQIEDLYPLSPMQQGMLFHTLYEQQGGDYINQLRVDVDGLDPERFRQAWQATVERHDILRSGFLWQGELPAPIQVVHKRMALDFVEHDWRGQPRQQEALDTLADAERQRGFELSTAPLLRLALVRTGENRHHLIYTNHHILMDGWSNSQLLGEVLQRYAGQVPSHVPGRYRDYIAWLQRQDAQAGERFWKEQLLALDEPTRLAQSMVAAPQALNASGHAAYLHSLDVQQTRRLGEFARQQKVTVNTLVQAAWLLLLQRCTGQDTVVFGATVSGRPAELKGVEQQIGLFINTLPVVATPRPDMTASDWLQAVQSHNLILRDYEHTPLYEVQRWAGLGAEALFDNILVFENYPVSQALEQGSPGQLRFSSVGNHEQTNYPLTLLVGVGESLSLEFKYALASFSEAAVTQLGEYLENLLLGIMLDAQQALGELPLLGGAEQSRILHEWNPPASHFPSERCVHELIQAQALKTPDARAVLFGGQTLSYEQLNTRANRLAHKLIESGVGPEVRVGVALQRSTEMVVALLAVLKTGGAYVPLDPDYPQDRLAHMLQDSQAQILLTESALLEVLPTLESVQTLQLDAGAGWLDGYSSENPQVVATPDNLAYVIYTSGSTGLPKGVAIAHRNVLALIDWSLQVYSPADLQGVLASTSICFDLSVWELFVTLSAGGYIVLARNALELPELPARDQVRLINTVPSAIAALQRGGQIPDGIRIINLAGEPLKQSLVDKLYENPGLQHVYDLYGPSEDTTYSTYTRREKGGRANIGRAISNTQSYILGADLQAVPAGRAGELYLAGAGVTRGYLARPALTAEKYVPNPFATDGGRLYRTGDLTRYRDDGVIEYIGRIDHQVKVRGFRIELGEIEARLVQQEAVREAFVLAQDGEGGQQLVAYIVPAEAEVALDAERQANLREDIKARLKDNLPDYMVPTYLLFLEALPLTPNGKLDRKALPKADASQMQQAYVAPQTELEQQLATIWADVLKLDRVGLTDNFFELGGHSLDALRLVSEIKQALGLELTLNTVFTSPDVQQMARFATTRQAPKADNIVALGGTGQPVFCFHPAGGTVYCYLSLAARLKDSYSVYGVLNEAYLHEDWSETSWQAMVQRYVGNIRKVQPHGPYRLLGWSLGGSIAMDAASELEAMGEEVSFLGLFDPTPPEDAAHQQVELQVPAAQLAAESEWRAVIDKLSLLYPAQAGLIGSRLRDEAQLSWDSIFAWMVAHTDLPRAELDRAVTLFKAEFDSALVNEVFNDLRRLFAAYSYRPLRVSPHLWWSADYSEAQVMGLEEAISALAGGQRPGSSFRVESCHEDMIVSATLLDSLRERFLALR